jgi:hypothetical protein
VSDRRAYVRYGGGGNNYCNSGDRLASASGMKQVSNGFRLRSGWDIQEFLISANKDRSVQARKRQCAFRLRLGHRSRSHCVLLNLSRAWMLEVIVAGLPKGDKRRPMISATAEQHRRSGLAAVTGKHYEGGHWLGRFAVYLVTRRSIALK